MQPVERLQTELARHHLSRTKARDAVYLTIGRLRSCPPGEIVRALAGTVDRRTIFRTLKLFLEIGVISRMLKGHIELKVPFKQRHYHFWCINCGKRVDFYDEKLEESIKRTAGRRWLLLDHQVELSGVCGLCSHVDDVVVEAITDGWATP